MKFLTASIVAAIVLAFSATSASADNYGGVSAATERQMKHLIYRYFGSGYVGLTMVCIARRESGLNPRAANWSDSNGGSFGLFQINGIHRHRYPNGKVESIRSFSQRMFNPLQNIQSALALYRKAGLSPWRSTSGSCGV